MTTGTWQLTSVSRCRRTAQQTGLDVILGGSGLGGHWRKAWVGEGADTHCLGRVNSSSSRTGHGTGKGTLCPKEPRAELTKVPFIILASCIPAQWYFPIPVTHVIGQPGAIPPVRPRGNVVQISYSSTLNLRSKTLTSLLLTGIILLWIYLGNRRSLPRPVGNMCRARHPTSRVQRIEGLRGNFASFWRACDGQDCITSTPLPLQPRRASVSPSETSLRHTLVYLLPACLPESAERRDIRDLAATEQLGQPNQPAHVSSAISNLPVLLLIRAHQGSLSCLCVTSGGSTDIIRIMSALSLPPSRPQRPVRNADACGNRGWLAWPTRLSIPMRSHLTLAQATQWSIRLHWSQWTQLAYDVDI